MFDYPVASSQRSERSYNLIGIHPGEHVKCPSWFPLVIRLVCRAWRRLSSVFALHPPVAGPTDLAITAALDEIEAVTRVAGSRWR